MIQGKLDQALYLTSATLIGGIAGGSAGDAEDGAITGAQTALNAATNNYMAHQRDFREEQSACEKDHSGLGCSAVLSMLPGTHEVPIGSTSSGYQVVANVGEDGAQSYWITAPGGETMIMQPREWAVFSGLSPAAQQATFAAPQWQLDLASAIDYAVIGNTDQAQSNYLHLFTDPSFWGESLLSLGAGYVGTAAVLGRGKGGVAWNPLTGPGPLGEKIASTFRGASYTELTTAETTTLYRVWGGSAKEIGAYWTRSPPAGPMQSMIDSALNPAWGNTATYVTKIEIPAGEKIFEGFAAPQGGLVGGGNQVFIPKVDPTWILK